MKLFVALFAISATISSCSFVQEKLGGSGEKRTLTTEMDKVSYSIGYNMGKNFRIQNVEVDVSALLAGVNDGKTEATPVLTEADQAATMRVFQTSHMKKQNEGKQLQCLIEKKIHLQKVHLQKCHCPLRATARK